MSLQSQVQLVEVQQLNQEDFVNELIDKRDHVRGFSYVLNRFLILFYKCLYLRKRKKFTTLIELVLPLLIFIYVISSMGLPKKVNNEQPSMFLPANMGILRDGYPIYFDGNCYYDFNKTKGNVDEGRLNVILAKLADQRNERLDFKKRPENITDLKYFLLDIHKLNDKSFDYEFTVQSDYERYLSRKQGGIYPIESFQDQGFDRLHQRLVYYYTLDLNADVESYNVGFKIVNFNEYTRLGDEDSGNGQKKYQYSEIFDYFSLAIFISFFINCIFVLSSICEERKKRSSEFLKLMGASDGEIFLGHFLNHFIVWLIPLIGCLIFLNVKSDVLNFEILFLFFFFSCLFLVYLISFLFLCSAPFQKYIYAEIIFVVATFSLAGRYATRTVLREQKDGRSFVELILIVHPLAQIQKVSSILTALSYKLDFTENIFTVIFSSPQKEISLFALIVITLVYMTIFLLLTNYIIQVNPLQRGISKPFGYFLSPSYWVKPKPINDYKIPEKKEFQMQPADKKPAIILKDVDKAYRSWFYFGKYQVLKKFSFAVFEKQITVLLGHNGAGKTTTMDLISGLLSSDAGQISVMGIPVSAYSSGFKKVLGYCPQENIFYEALSVRENLKIAGILKGTSFKSIDKKILNLASKFDLQSKLNLPACKLSGGMKRRLCLAMAIIGYNDVLVIDEPTSGLDPENRRKVWEILLELRKHKSVLLTTHFLEEADVLGDQIAIMSSGQVKCCGSTLFLKKLYHVGYLLRLELTHQKRADDILRLIKNYIPNAIYENQQSNELFYRLLPNEDESENLNLMIANLFDQFEDTSIKNEYGIKAYGLTNTSLEDVFIKIGELDEKEKNGQEQKEEVNILNLEEHPLHNLDRVAGFKLYLQQFLGIFDKKFRLTYKNLSLFVSSIYPLIFPILILIALSAILKSIDRESNFTYNSFNPSDKFSDNEVLMVKNEFNKNTDLFTKENRDWVKKTYGLYFTDKDSTNATKTIMQEATSAGFDKFNARFFLLPNRTADKSYSFLINQYKLPYSYIKSVDIFYQLIAKLAGHEFTINTKYNYIESDDQSRSVQRAFFDYAVVRLITGILFLFAFPIIFSFPFVAFVDLLHDEMNSGALSMQIIAGLSKTMYWFANLVFDYFFMIIIFSISCILLLIFDTEKLFSSNILLLFTSFILTTLGCLLTTYLIINLNIKREITDILVKYYLLVLGFAFGIADMIYMTTNTSPNQAKISMPLSFLYKVLSPVYNALDTAFYLAEDYSHRKCMEKVEENNRHFCKSLLAREYDFLYNVLEYFLCFFMYAALIFLVNYYSTSVLMFVEKFALFRKKSEQSDAESDQAQKRIVNVNHLSQIKDENVEREKELASMIVETRNLQNNILVVNDLYKLFGTFEAVNHLNFTVKKGECFGLLGVNGAGKTTTFKMIGGSIMPTSGTIILDYHTFALNPYEYYRRLGYCPQENTHTNRVSVTDNLKFYAKINGVPSHLIDRAVNMLIHECDLQDHRYKFAEKLSGGNKRKLSTAISLIGKKDLILMDEPTTGVDPVSRRKLWKTIDFYKKQLDTSFILTSHSMDEVEQLCNTISIIVKGEFKVLGNFSYLRDKYSQGFTITMKIKESNNNDAYIKDLKDRMENDFKGKATLKEFYMSTMVYIILSKIYNWSHLFRAMESIKTQMDLEGFLVSETNLEQIFLSFAEQPQID